MYPHDSIQFERDLGDMGDMDLDDHNDVSDEQIRTPHMIEQELPIFEKKSMLDEDEQMEPPSVSQKPPTRYKILLCLLE